MKHGLKGLLFVFSVAACSTAESQKTVKHDTNFEVGEAKPNQFWWPDKVNLSPLRQNTRMLTQWDLNSIMRKNLKNLFKTVKKDIATVMKTSQDWWPTDYGIMVHFY